MTNREQIMAAFQLFNSGQIKEAQKLCDRIEKNFNIDDDETEFKIEAKVCQPYKKTASELPDELIWNNVADKSGFDPSEYEISVYISSKSKEEILLMKGNAYVEDCYGHALTNCYIKENGQIRSSTYRGRIIGREALKKWLDAEFGKAEQW